MAIQATHLGTIGLVILVAVSAIGFASPPVAAQSAADPAFIVEVNADGSALISLRSTLDLTTDAEQQAFETLIDDEQAQADAESRFLDRMRAVAGDAENATGREMRVSDPSIDLRRSDDNRVGIVTLSVTWSGLAAKEDGVLVVTEPFASGFTTDRPFVLLAPEGYLIADAAPAPAESSETSATWSAGSNLDGFIVELRPAPTPTPTEPVETTRTGGQPGFGLLIALLSVIGAAAWATARRFNR